MKLINQKHRYNLQLFAGKDTDKGGEGDDNQDDDDEDEDDEDTSEKKSKKLEKTFTQEELDAAIERRLNRERKKAEKAKAQQEEDKKKSPEEKNDDRYSKMEKELQSMQAKMICLEHGVEKSNIKDVVALANTYVDDETDFEEALETVLKKYPHFAKQQEEEEDETKKKQSYKPKKGGKEKPLNPWAKETYNLTKQGELIKEDPTAAKELAASAGVTLLI